MKSLYESILTSTKSGRKSFIFNTLGDLLKKYKDEHLYYGVNGEKICIPHEGLAYIDNVFRFVFEKDRKKDILKDIKKWLKNNGYKNDALDDLNSRIDLYNLEDNRYYNNWEEHLNNYYEMIVLKVDNTVLFIEMIKNAINYTMYIFSLEIDRYSNYVEDWNTDKTLISVLKNKLG